MTTLKLKIRTLLIALIIIITMACMSGCETPITYPPGGYNYPAKGSVTDTNFYFYPLRNVFSKRDSFRAAQMDMVYNAFDEPNLSIKPMGQDVFRLEFDGFKIRHTIVTFTKNEMTVKTGGDQYLYDYLQDENRLTDIEKRHYHFFEWRGYPYYKVSISERSRYVDSMIKVMPQLVDLKYFKYLENKTKIPNTIPYKYKIKKIALSYKEYQRLVSFINNAGYWKLPYDIPCEAEFFDGYGYSLEANTKTKYNCVAAGTCNEDKSKFASICQEIIKTAGLEKQLDLLWFNKPKKPETSKPPVIPIQDVTLADVKPDSNYNRKKATPKHK